MPVRGKFRGSSYPRKSERFLTSALSCPVGEVLDVSKEGFRLSSPKKLKLQKGEVHQIVLRANDQQVRVNARVQWISRAGIWPPRYEAGFLIIDDRPGVGRAVLQLGQFGCIGGSDDGDAVETGNGQNLSAEQQKTQAVPKIKAAVEIEDLYALLDVHPDADADEIKSAYRKTVRIYHPDYNDSFDAAQMFDKVVKAWAVLGDPKRRKWYDKLRTGEIAA